MNSEGRHEQSTDGIRKESSADGEVAPPSPVRHSAPSPQDGKTKAFPQAREPLRPDDRQTMVIPPVRHDRPAQYRDPIDAVKAALDGTPPPRFPPPGPPTGGGPP
ncbi:MAG: penicillin-binding protein, partial [Mycobacterium sp.]